MSAGRDAVTGAQLREAQRAVIGMFRSKGFPVAWVNRNAVDLLAQASLEYTEWLENHEPEENPVGWLVTCAYRRGLNLLSAQGRRPSTSIDAVFDLADHSTPTPDQQVLDDDRQERLRAALRCLPQRERKLLSLVYFEDHSVREAGRRLGWRKSAADRHHQAALERLSAVVDRSLLSPAGLGVAAWNATRGDGPRFWATGRTGPLGAVREGTAVVVETVVSAGRRFGEAARRLIPFGDTIPVAATGGAGRVLGACGAAVIAAACAVAVSTAIPGPSAERPPAGSAPRTAIQRFPGGSTSESAPARSHPEQTATNPSPKPRVRGSRLAEGVRDSAERRGGVAKPVAVNQATHQEIEEEFGLEGGSGSAPTPSPPPPAEEPAESSPPARVGGSAPPASGAAVEEEFGL